MGGFRLLRDVIVTYRQARHGLPTRRAAAASIHFFAMFVAAVTGMILGLGWLPNDASPMRSFWQPVALAVGAAVVAYCVMVLLECCFGFGALISLADIMAGALVGVMVIAFWEGLFNRSGPEWTNWLPLVGAIVGFIMGRCFCQIANAKEESNFES